MTRTKPQGELWLQDKGLRSFWALLLVVLLPLTAVAEPSPFVALPEPGASPQEVAAAVKGSAEAAPGEQGAPEPDRPAQVDPSLVNKKVVVSTRDGRVYKGKLVQVTADTITVQTKQGLQQFPLTEVVKLQQQPGKWKTALIIVGVAVGVWIAVGLAVAANEH